MSKKEMVRRVGIVAFVLLAISALGTFFDIPEARGALIASFISFCAIAWLMNGIKKAPPEPILLEGNVVGEDGTPLNGVWIRAYYAPQLGTVQGWEVAGVDITNEDGEFSIEAERGQDKIVLKYELPGDSMSNFFDGKWIDNCKIYDFSSQELRLVIYND